MGNQANNENIAAFLGGEVYVYYRRGSVEMTAWKGEIVKSIRQKLLFDGTTKDVGDTIECSSLKFDKSWDWLMEAWRMIVARVNLRDQKTREAFVNHEGYKYLTFGCQNGFLDKAYEGLVRCVDWYEKEVSKRKL